MVISLYYFWQELMRLLQSHGIDFSFSWRSFAELYEEIYDKKQSRLQAFCARNAAPISFSYIIPESLSFSVMDGSPLGLQHSGTFYDFRAVRMWPRGSLPIKHCPPILQVRVQQGTTNQPMGLYISARTHRVWNMHRYHTCQPVDQSSTHP